VSDPQINVFDPFDLGVDPQKEVSDPLREGVDPLKDLSDPLQNMSPLILWKSGFIAA